MDAGGARLSGVATFVGDVGSALPQPGSGRRPRPQQTPLPETETQPAFAAQGGAEIRPSGAQSTPLLRFPAGALRSPSARLLEAARRGGPQDGAVPLQSQDLQVQSRRRLAPEKRQIGRAQVG